MKLKLRQCISLISFTVIFLATFAPLSNAAGQSGLTMYVRSDTTSTSDTLIQEFYSGICWQGGVSNINFQWGYGGQGSCPIDYFTDFITGYIKAPESGTIYFYDLSDDGFYLKINDTVVINDWEEQGVNSPNGQGSFKMIKDSIYSIKIWHHESEGGAWNQLFWNTKNDFASSSLVPNSHLATDPTYWVSIIQPCNFKGNSGYAYNSVGSAHSASSALSKSNGAGACQNAVSR